MDDFGRFHFNNMEEVIEYAMNVIRIRGGSYNKSATLDEIDSADKNMMTTVISQLPQFIALLNTNERLLSNMCGIVNMATNMTSNTGSIGSSASTIQNTTISAYPFSTTTTQSFNQIRPSNNGTSFVNANSVIKNGANTQNGHSSLDSSNKFVHKFITF